MILMLVDESPEHLPGKWTHEQAMNNLRLFARCAIARLHLRRLNRSRRAQLLTEQDRRLIDEACIRGEFINEQLIKKIRILRRLRELEKEARQIKEAVNA